MTDRRARFPELIFSIALAGVTLAGTPWSASPCLAAGPEPRTQGKDSPPSFWFPGGMGMFVPPFYQAFKNIDLGGLDSIQHERFVHWVNSEYCSCAQQGCRRDTIANCYTNDSMCPRAPVRLREILARAKKGESVPGSVKAAVSVSPTQAPSTR